MNIKSVLKQLGISPDRARILRVGSVKLHGVMFVYRAVAPVDFLGDPAHPLAPWREGRDGLGDKQWEAKMRDIASGKVNDPTVIAESIGQVKKAYRSMFMHAVLWPKLSDKEAPDMVCVDDVLADMTTANELYMAIVENSVEKKRLLIYWTLKLLSWTLSRIGMGAYLMKWRASRMKTLASIEPSAQRR